MEWIFFFGWAVAFIVTLILTAVFLVKAAVMDLRERQVYSMPCYILTFCWYNLLYITGIWSWQFLAGFFAIHFGILWMLKTCRGWGAGDSDVWLFLSAVILMADKAGQWQQAAEIELGLLTLSLIISIVAGAIEFKVKKQRLRWDSQLALVVGFAAVGVGCIAKILIGGIF